MVPDHRDRNHQYDDVRHEVQKKADEVDGMELVAMAVDGFVPGVIERDTVRHDRQNNGNILGEAEEP